jgi:RNA polymerase sigma-70 factor (ECF subfamily)
MSGEHDNPERWLEEHGDYLYRYALYRCRDAHVAEDLVQETFLAALSAWERRQGTSSVRTWLTGILNHKFVDSLRKRYRETPHEDETLNALAAAASANAAPSGFQDWGSDPATLLENKEFRSRFEECVSKLNKRMYELYTLREIDGQSPESICNDFSISQTNLRVILHRAREQLRRCLEENWFTPGKVTQ